MPLIFCPQSSVLCPLIDTPVTRLAAKRNPRAGLARCALNTLRYLSRPVKHVVLRALLAPRIQRGDGAVRKGQTH